MIRKDTLTIRFKLNIKFFSTVNICIRKTLNVISIRSHFPTIYLSLIAIC